MSVLLNLESYDGYSRFMAVSHLDDAAIRKAKAAFARYKLNRTITDGGFYDKSWKITDQLHNYRISFNIDEEQYNKKTLPWSGCTPECFVECVKAYVSFQMGKYNVQFLRQIAKALLSLAGKTEREIIHDAAYYNLRLHIVEFLNILPGDELSIAQLIEELEDYDWYYRRNGFSRKLADFKYYLNFNRVLDRFWDSAEKDEKLYYFPVWLWWKLTAILPLRVTEFLMTPRDCVIMKNGKPHITVRRTRKKKGKREVYYRVDRDYETYTYEIPEWMSAEIKSYVSATNSYRQSILGTIFIPAVGKHTLGYFSYSQMTHRMESFCINVIGQKTYPIKLGDTRHLAMISLILSGGSPSICKQLAGHEDINISAGYYSNISTVVETAVYEMCHGHSNENMIKGSNRYPVNLPEQMVKISDGWCDFTPVEYGDISECMKSYSTSGGYGDCLSCYHFYPDDPGLKVKLRNEYKKEVDEDGEYLLQMINLVRRGRGYTEDIEQALLRIQGSSYRYGKLLIKREMEHKQWRDQEKQAQKR